MRIHTYVILLSVCCSAFFFFTACNKDQTTTVLQSGLKIEPFEKDKLNALPIIGYLKTDAPLYPVVDGDAKEAIWSLTEPFDIQTTADEKGFAPTITMKALYDNYYLFLLATWQDTSQSAQKNIWWYGSPNPGDTTYATRKDYTWTQISAPYYGTLARLQKIRVDTTTTPPDTQYVYDYSSVKFSGDEDAFAIMFNVNSTNFLNCTNFCHGNTMRMDTDEMADVWEWGATRTNIKNTADDLSLSDQGFTGDAGIAAYELNLKEGHPAFASTLDPGANVPVLVDSAAILFYPQLPWTGGNKIPGYVMHTPAGSRGDLLVKGHFKDGVWTLEMRRELDTLVADGTDVILNPDADANLEFHIALYDNAHGSSHATSTGVNLLHFLQYNEKKKQ
jgi:hypothetical protein